MSPGNRIIVMKSAQLTVLLLFREMYIQTFPLSYKHAVFCSRNEIIVAGLYCLLDLNLYVSYSICVRHLFRSKAVSNQIFFQKRPIFLIKHASCSELPSNTSKMLFLCRILAFSTSVLRNF